MKKRNKQDRLKQTNKQKSKNIAYKTKNIYRYICFLIKKKKKNVETPPLSVPPTKFPPSEEALAMTKAAARRMSMFSSELTILGWTGGVLFFFWLFKVHHWFIFCYFVFEVFFVLRFLRVFFWVPRMFLVGFGVARGDPPRGGGLWPQAFFLVSPGGKGWRGLLVFKGVVFGFWGFGGLLVLRFVFLCFWRFWWVLGVLGGFGFWF